MSRPDYYHPQADWNLIPAHMHDAVVNYVMNGISGGSFLDAVLCNDFLNAAGRADAENTRALKNWAIFIYQFTPAFCHGSPEHVNEWCAVGGINGIEKTRKLAAETPGYIETTGYAQALDEPRPAEATGEYKWEKKNE